MRVQTNTCASSQYRIDHSRLTHHVHAARPIAKGEEITITCECFTCLHSPCPDIPDTNPFEPHSVRQNALQNAFHFSCKCERCRSASASDATLSEINDLQKILGDWSAQSTATIEKAESLLALMKEQGFDGFLDTAYGYAALAYNAVGDAKEAKRYAELAIEAIVLKDGQGTKDWAMWKEMVQDPKKHWSWKYRKP